MVNVRKISLLIAFAACSLTAGAVEWNVGADNMVVEKQSRDNLMTFEIFINSNSLICMEDTPTTGYLEIYSILGVRVCSVNLKLCAYGYTIDLPKGIYILRAGKVAKKVLVR